MTESEIIKDLCMRILEKEKELLKEVKSLETIECPGCGSRVRIRMAARMAYCKKCNLVAKVQWTWQPPGINGGAEDGSPS